MSEEMKKHQRCRHYVMGTFDEVRNGRGHYCAPNAKTLGEAWEQKQEIDPAGCEDCPNFQSAYIEFPLTIKGITTGDMEPWDIGMYPVRVRPCGEDKTYIGIYLGRFPRQIHVTYSEKSGELKVGATTNPCIYIPEKDGVCWGDESWWSRIESEEELEDITDETIENQWYMKALRQIEEKEVTEK